MPFQPSSTPCGWKLQVKVSHFTEQNCTALLTSLVYRLSTAHSSLRSDRCWQVSNVASALAAPSTAFARHVMPYDHELLS